MVVVRLEQQGSVAAAAPPTETVNQHRQDARWRLRNWVELEEKARLGEGEEQWGGLELQTEVR